MTLLIGNKRKKEKTIGWKRIGFRKWISPKGGTLLIHNEGSYKAGDPYSKGWGVLIEDDPRSDECFKLKSEIYKLKEVGIVEVPVNYRPVTVE